jgi:tetratricopeptide (TPR) repeat protein
MGWAILLAISPGITVPSHSVAQAVTQQVSQAEPQTLEQQGKAFYDTGRFTEAVAALQQAVQAYQMQGGSVPQAIALTNLALTYHQLGDWTQANDAINSSLNLLASLVTDPSDSCVTCEATRRLAEVEALDIRGQLQFSQGQTEAALDTWQQAAQTYKQLQDTDLFELPARGRLTRNQIQQSRGLQALGFYQRAVMLLNELEQTLQSEPDSLTKVAELRSLGEALLRTGDLKQSEQRLQQSLAIAQRLATDSAPAKVTESIALSQLSLGNTARAQRDVSAALEWYQQAANSEQTSLQANLNRFSLLIETKEIEKAQALLPQIERRLETLPLNRATIYARINLAQSLTKSTLDSSSVDAATLLSTAVQQSEQLGDRRTQAYGIGLLGRLYEKTQQWSFAKDLTQQALRLALSNNAADITYLWQWQLG